MNTDPTELKQVIQEEINNEISLIILEKKVKELEKSGCSKQEINEGVMDTLSGLGKGFMQLSGGLSGAAKESAIEWVIEKLADQFDINTDGLIASTVKYGIANMTLDDWQAAIAGDCERITKIIENAIIEKMVRAVVNKTSRIIGLSLRRQLGVPRDTLDHFVGESLEKLIGNMISNHLVNTEFVKSITSKISDEVCKIDLGDVVKQAMAQ